MADVFISYSHADAETAEHIARSFETLGLSVWWDSRMFSAESIHHAVSEHLDNAKAVVVLWSPESVKSKWVVSEASAGEKAGKLASVIIKPSRLPVYFRELRHEDLTHWSGRTSDKEFQRLAIQVVALAKGQMGAAEIPFDGMSAPRLKLIARDSNESNRIRNIAAAIGVAAIAFYLVAHFFGVSVRSVLGPYWETLIVTVIGVFLLFLFAERLLPAGSKALVQRWLLAEADLRPLTSSQAFLAMFEAVFTHRHLTLKCFWRSMVATIIVYVAFLLLFADSAAAFRGLAVGLERFLGIKGIYPLTQDYIDSRQATLEMNAVGLLVILLATNVVVDYISLWETRIVLKWAAKGLPLLIAVLLDLVLTISIFVISLPIGPMFVIVAMGSFSSAALPEAAEFAPDIWRTMAMIFVGNSLAELDAVIRGQASIYTVTLLVAFASTFITSIWLILALLFAPVVRFAASNSVFKALFDTKQHAVAALGFVAAAATLLVGGSAYTSIGVLRVEWFNTFEDFRDCDKCPLMVKIPAGAFLMGSPESEGHTNGPGARQHNEGPQHLVQIQPFAIGVFEVTFDEWAACVADGYCISNSAPGDNGWGRGQRPVIFISWNDIYSTKGFIDWLNSKVEGNPYRLPSEAEWEYAARAGAVGPYLTAVAPGPFEENVPEKPDLCFYRYWGQSLPVGSFQRNNFGLYDVLGNVAELTADCYNDSYIAAPGDGTVRADGDCKSAASRGGGWDCHHRLAFRGWSMSREENNSNFGFRIARDLESSSRMNARLVTSNSCPQRPSVGIRNSSASTALPMVTPRGKGRRFCRSAR